ncbi:MAG: hypothetical protein H6Q14_928 [Bacteroidetes bacterium]|nr:hypothetical protein [Bacteroidota bacterium]
MKFYKLTILVVAFVATTNMAYSKNGFAIVIDKKSYAEAKAEVQQYASSVEADGLKTYIVIDKWDQPDSIKAELKRLYSLKQNSIEGAVFIGDIPIPMLRDAQHLTSAFKMNQKLNWQRSSIASDRFYDDFGLKFNFLKQDSIKPLYFYYSLRSDSQQFLHSDIYTARIRPLEKGKKDKYAQLRDYLKKVVEIKKSEKNNVIDNLTVARGHGYNSESRVAWSGEHLALREQLPTVFNTGSFVKFMDFDTYWPMKPYWLNEVQRPDLDIMLFHHHGSNDRQYISEYKPGSEPNTAIENVKIYLRSKVASAVKRGKTKEEAITMYMKYLDVPRSWCEEAFDSTLIAKDSALEASLEASVEDILALKPNARFVMFDACYNGSFYEDEYIGGAYIFNDGKTIVTQGNTVNTIQDKWPDEFLGLLNYGLRIGEWGKYTHFLETHILGDPTFHFAKNTKDNLDINEALSTQKNDTKFWLTNLSNPHPDVQAVALRVLFDNRYSGISALLKKTYFESTSMIVRLETLMLLSELNNDDFLDVLPAATADSYELVRRYALEFCTKNGSPKLLPAIAKSILNDNTSERVAFKISSGYRMLNLDLLEKELLRQADALPLYSKDRLNNALENIQSTNKSKKEDFALIADKGQKLKSRLQEISRFRNNPVSDEAEILMKVLSDKRDDVAARLAAAEALGWYNYSYRKAFIMNELNKFLPKETDPKLIGEVQKTINRLQGK